MTTTTLYVPPDADEAYRDWGATCGPNALASILGGPVMGLKGVMQPYRGYTTFADMTRALGRLGVEYMVLRKDFNLSGDALIGWPGYHIEEWRGRLSIVQWHGSWMKPGVHPGAALTRTHWVACEHETKMVYDVNAGPTQDGGWVTFAEWQGIAKTIMAECRGCDGTWSTRSTILVR